MKINWRSIALSAAAAIALSGSWAIADYQLTTGAGTTIFAFTCATTKVCPGQVPMKSDGTELFTSGAPGQVNVLGTVPLPIGAATSALQTTINTTLGSPFQAGGSIGNTAFGISGTLPAFAAIPTFKIDQTTPGTTNLVSIGTNGTVNPTTAANWGIGTSTQNSASVANGHLALGQFNTSPTTITSGNMSPLQMDNSGKLLVNCTGCSSSSAITSWGGGTLGAMANYGTSPGAVLVPGVNAFVTNSNANGQATMANSSPVAIASNQSAIPASQSGTWTVQPGNTANTTAWLVRQNDGTNSQVLDPCQTVAKTYTPVSMTTATTTRIVAPTSAKKTYICSIVLVAGAADNVAVVEGTGGTCGTGTAGVIGGTTAANGLNLAANGGITLGSGNAAIAATAGTNVDFCFITSSTGPLAGHVAWVQQ